MKHIKENKKFFCFYIVLAILGIAIIVFSYNDHFLYKEPIAKVISSKEELINREVIGYGYTDEVYLQTITAKIINGDDKGKTVTINNEYYKGEAYTQKYNIDDEIFITINKENGKITDTFIDGYKRDTYIVILIVFFVLIITFVGHLKGFLSIISVILNIIIFNIIVSLHMKGVSLPILSFLGAIIFSIVCLSLVSGINKKTGAAILSSIAGITITMIITLIVIYFTNYSGIRFEQMELLTGSYKSIFLSELILGGLGAIMDIGISISSSLNELVEKDNNITSKALIKSGFAIGKDIMSTMINVLFFTYICTSIPNLVIFFRNGMELHYLISEFISLELTRALIGAIGIVITIPISIYVSTYFYKRRDSK